jgi:hypothetical protein
MRLCAFIAIVLINMDAWWNTPATDPTPLAMRQFQNDGSVPDQLQQATLTQNYGPLVWPALALALGAVVFWDDIANWWKRDSAVKPAS